MKTANALNAVPKSVQPKTGDALHDIWQAVTGANAEDVQQQLPHALPLPR